MKTVNEWFFKQLILVFTALKVSLTKADWMKEPIKLNEKLNQLQFDLIKEWLPKWTRKERMIKERNEIDEWANSEFSNWNGID